MAFTKHTLTFLSIFALFSFAFIPLYSNSTPSPSPSSSSSDDTDTDAADSPLSLSELFELALPEIGVQKKAATTETEGSKVASKQLEAMEYKINEFKTTLKKRVTDPNTSQSEKSCLTQCEENFGDAIDGVKTSIESIRKQDLAKANVDVSAIATDVDTCNDCYLEMKSEDMEIKAVNDWVKGVTGDILVNLKKA